MVYRLTTEKIMNTNTNKLVLPNIEKVCEKVHNRWMEDARGKGITTREHEGEELMVPYDQLSDKGKEHVRNKVNNLYQAIEEVNEYEAQEGHKAKATL